MTDPDFDEQLAELGSYLPAEDPEHQEALYEFIETSQMRRENLEMLGRALERDKFNRARGLYSRENDFDSEYTEKFREVTDLLMEEESEAAGAAVKLGMALKSEYYDALQNANIAQEGGSTGMVETVLEKGSV